MKTGLQLKGKEQQAVKEPVRDMDIMQMAKVMGNQAVTDMYTRSANCNDEVLQRTVIVHGRELVWEAGKNGKTAEEAIQKIIDQRGASLWLLERMVKDLNTVYSFASAAQLVDYFHSSVFEPLNPGLYNLHIAASATIVMQGSRRADYAAAEAAAGAAAGEGQTWHHIEDYNATTNRCTMVLIPTVIHSSFAHYGAVSQWEQAHTGTKYG